MLGDSIPCYMSVRFPETNPLLAQFLNFYSSKHYFQPSVNKLSVLRSNMHIWGKYSISQFGIGKNEKSQNYSKNKMKDKESG